MAQLKKLRVKVVLGEEVTPETTGLDQFDEIVVATGASPVVPRIPGIESKHVVTAKEVLERRTDIGEKIVVIGAGGTGCATALYLAEMGKKVTLVEMLSKIGTDMGRVTRWISLHFLKEHHVDVFTHTKLEEVTETGLVVSRGGEKMALTADTVVLAMGVRSEKKLLESLAGRGAKVHAIGDCKEPRKVIDAIHEAWEVARQI